MVQEFETYYQDKKIVIPEDLVIINDQYSKVITEAGNEYAKTYVVPNGKTFYIRHFNTSCPGKCCICAGLYWDYDTENEECLIDSCSDARLRGLDLEVVGDGVKELAIVLKHYNESEGGVGLAAQYKGYYLN